MTLHKKKAIFFSLVGFLGYYYNIYTRFYNKFKQETISQRIRKRLLKKTKLLTELKEVESKLPSEVAEEAKEFFLAKDFELIQGLRRRTLLKVAEENNWIDTKFENSFLAASGFQKKKNREKSNMTLKEFIGFLEHVVENNPESSPQEVLAQLKEGITPLLKEEQKKGHKWVQKLKNQEQEQKLQQAQNLKDIFNLQPKEPTELDSLESQIQSLRDQCDALPTNESSKLTQLYNEIKTLEKHRSLLLNKG